MHRNHNIKNVHNQQETSDAKKSHIICPLCTGNELVCGTYKKLETHLEVNHNIKLEVQTYNFSSRKNYEQWSEEQKIDTTYAVAPTRYNDYVEKSYTSNRSNSLGYGSKYSKQMKKAGGSIKMYGVCPSCINIKIWETGHEEEIRSQHLSKLEKTEIVTKLCNVVTVDRIISDARKVTSENIQRINTLNRNDVSYLMTHLKVREWNANGKTIVSFSSSRVKVIQHCV